MDFPEDTTSGIYAHIHVVCTKCTVDSVDEENFVAVEILGYFDHHWLYND